MSTSFDYIVNRFTHTLIIGSMPGAASLAAQEYYAYKYNLFWRFVFEAFGQDYQNPNFNEKISLLLAHGFGLWDAAQSCRRDGSLDTHIKDVIPNDFSALFAKYPHINRLLFNGKKAFQLFKQFQGDLLCEMEYAILPSTSPANASIPLAERRRIWIEALLKQ